MAYIDYTTQKNALLSQLATIEKAERAQAEAQLKRANELALAELKLKKAQDNLVAFNKRLAAANAAVSSAALELKLLKEAVPQQGFLTAFYSAPAISDEHLRKAKNAAAKKKEYHECAELRSWIKEQGHQPLNTPGGPIGPLRKQKAAILATFNAGVGST